MILINQLRDNIVRLGQTDSGNYSTAFPKRFVERLLEATSDSANLWTRYS
jgi:hypothetical protein